MEAANVGLALMYARHTAAKDNHPADAGLPDVRFTSEDLLVVLALLSFRTQARM